MNGIRNSENTPNAYCFWPTGVELKKRAYVEHTAKAMAPKLWYPNGNQALLKYSSGK